MAAESKQERDIYELLGVEPNVSTKLAQDMYWRRVNSYLDADRTGDPTARAAISELNEALAIILDADRRATYDSERKALTPAQPARAPERRAKYRGLATLALVPVIGAAMWLALLLSGTLASVIVGVVGIVALLLAARWANSETVQGQSPFRMLQLRDDASVDDVEAAYHAQVSHLLLRVRNDRRALRELEALDRAYLGALESIARGGAAGSGSDLLTRGVAAGGNSIARGLEWLGNALTSVLATIARRLVGGVGAASRAGWKAATRSDGAPASDAVDIERRLATSFRDAAVRAAEPHTEAPVVDPLVRASLILESAAGTRRVPLRAGPLSIGSDSNCDLVLRQDGVLPEHAIAWLRDGVVMLHVVHQGAHSLVNGHPSSWAMLEDGDTVELGDAVLRISIDP